MAPPTSNPFMGFITLTYNFFFLNQPCQSFHLSARQTNLLPSSLPSLHLPPGRCTRQWDLGERCAKNRGVQASCRDDGQRDPDGEDPRCSWSSLPRLSGPVKHLSFLHCPPPHLLHSTSCPTRGSGERQQVQQQLRGHGECFCLRIQVPRPQLQEQLVTLQEAVF